MNDLDALRMGVDRLDEETVRFLDARARRAVRIGRVKRSAGLPICQPVREAVVLERARETAGRLGSRLAADAVTRMFEPIIDKLRRLGAEKTETGLATGDQKARSASAPAAPMQGRGRSGEAGR